MSENKNYYYLKMKENFFDSEEIKLLEAAENGYLYSNILLKLYLKSLKSEGRLMFRENIPYNNKMLATITGHNIDVVDKAVRIFVEFGLIQILDSGAIYMADIQSFIGQSSSEGDRKRLYRQKIDEEQSKWDICPLEVGHLSDICPPEIEIEIEIEKKKEKKKEIYTPKFLSAWELYPHGLTKDKDQSFRNWMGKVNKHGFTEDDLLLAAQHYAKFCVLLDTSTEYRTLFSNFYGMKGTFKQFIDYDFTQLERDKRNAESKKESYAPKTPFDIYGCPADWGT